MDTEAIYSAVCQGRMAQGENQVNIPPGQNAFTYKPANVFSKADKRDFRYTEQGKAGGAKRALQQKGMAVPELSKFRKK